MNERTYDTIMNELAGNRRTDGLATTRMFSHNLIEMVNEDWTAEELLLYSVTVFAV